MAPQGTACLAGRPGLHRGPREAVHLYRDARPPGVFSCCVEWVGTHGAPTLLSARHAGGRSCGAELSGSRLRRGGGWGGSAHGETIKGLWVTCYRLCSCPCEPCTPRAPGAPNATHRQEDSGRTTRGFALFSVESPSVPESAGGRAGTSPPSPPPAEPVVQHAGPWDFNPKGM